MTFKIQCPNCQKAYTADPNWIGKRTRCRKCATAFVVEQPAEPAPDPVVEKVGPRPPQFLEAQEHRDALFDLGELNSKQRVRESKASPGRAKIEAQLCRMLIVLAFALSAIVTLRQNKTGIRSLTFLRLAAAGLLFILLILPMTYQSVARSFRRQRIKLPPGPTARVAATFVVPASIGFAAWQIYKTPTNLLIGLIIALPLMFAVFWLQFRARFLESLGSYVRACWWFLLGATMATALVVGVNFVINRALLNAHAVEYTFSPLDDALPWQTPAAPPETATQVAVVAHAGDRRTSPTAAPPLPPSLFDVSDGAMNLQPTRGPTSRGSGSLFVNPDDDQFLADLEKNGQPWIKQVSRPDGQSPFDFLVASSGTGPYVGFVLLDPGSPANRHFAVGMAINSRIRRTESFDITQDANPHAFPHDFLLSNDGTLLIDLKGMNLELISTATHRRDNFALVIPDEAPKQKLTAQLVGLARDQSVVVRWSSAGATSQVIQRYSYVARSLIGTSELPDTTLATESSAVSSNPAGPISLASIVIPARQPPSLCILDLNNPHSRTNCTALPPGVHELSDYETVELTFSPDASQVALLLTDRVQAVVYIWKSNELSAQPLKVSPSSLAPSLISSHVTGPRIRWINDNALLVDGQTVITTFTDHAGVIGSLCETPALGAVMIATDLVLVSYLGADGSCHLAEIEFNAAALRQASPAK